MLITYVDRYGIPDCRECTDGSANAPIVNKETPITAAGIWKYGIGACVNTENAHHGGAWNSSVFGYVMRHANQNITLDGCDGSV